MSKNRENEKPNWSTWLKSRRHRGPDWSGILLWRSYDSSTWAPCNSGSPIWWATFYIQKIEKLFWQSMVKFIIILISDLNLKGNIIFLPIRTVKWFSLYREKGPDFLEELNGIFWFCLVWYWEWCILIARDHMGIIPLYHGWDVYGQYYVASELKALEGVCNKIEVFPPGHLLFHRRRDEKMVFTWLDGI